MRAEDSLESFRPGSDGPWDCRQAAHLAARTGFGASPREIEALHALGPLRAVDARVDFPDSDPELEAGMRELGSPLFEHSDEHAPDLAEVGDLRAWWIYRLAHARHPLQERLTLFWHHHFACQQSEELPPALLLRQNELFRRLAGARFPELLREVARDPAMLVFLDGRNNVRERPNENWARELMELFTLGLDRYTQRDVVEVARVFTGWGIADGPAPAFEFRPGRHDPGDKQVLGSPVRGRAGAEGVEEGDQVLERLLDQPSAATFLAHKLLRWFLEDEPSPGLCEAAGECLRGHDWSVREFLRTLFRSRAFHARERHGGLFKTPVAFVVSAARALELQNVQLLRLERTLRELGMDLFHPPSVAGWNLGPAWIHAGSVLLRASFAERIAGLPHSARRLTGAPALDLDVLGAEADRPERLLESLAMRLCGRPLDPGRVAELAGVLERRGAGGQHARTRTGIELVLASPEFALE